MREVFRLHQHDIQQKADIVLVARQPMRAALALVAHQSIAGKSFAQVELDFMAAAKQAKLIQGNR